ncbi:cupredoxin domain-containing protein [Nanoarchaeota archaeon]
MKRLLLLLICIFIIGCAPKLPTMIPNHTTTTSFPTDMFEEIKPKNETPGNYTRVHIRMFQFGFDPETIELTVNEPVFLTITSSDVGHGFALPDFGINQKVPPQESITIKFTPDITGEFEFFESVYSGKDWKDMKGTLIVNP